MFCRFPRGHRVPTLEFAKGDTRGSTSTHLNAAEMLAFALASIQIMTGMCLFGASLYTSSHHSNDTL